LGWALLPGPFYFEVNMSKKTTGEPAELQDQAIANDGADSAPNAGPSTAIEMVPVRVLTPCRLGKPNDVVEVPKEAVNGLKELGCIDDHPDAVEFARGVIGVDGKDLVIE
jgi:hypothetical protein